jgi:hypothetical protein
MFFQSVLTRPRFTRPKAARELTVFRRVIFGFRTENLGQDNFQNSKNKRALKGNRRRATKARIGNLKFAKGTNFMKRAPRRLEIEPEDFDSVFLWRVFWKLLKQENPFRFLLKILLVGLSLAALIFFLVLVGEMTGA